MELFLFLGSLFFFLAFGIPIAMVLVLCAMVLMFHADMWDSMTIASCMLDGANNYPLMAIPFFVFAGEIMAAGGLSKRVVQFAQLLIGGVRGGLGYAAIVASSLFAGLMGSSVGEAAALGGLLLPMMKQQNYIPGRAGAVIASGAILGPIIPPSTNFIILGSCVSGLSITKLFMIGLLPGIFIGLALMALWFIIVRIDGYHDNIKFTKEEKRKILIDASPAFMMPVLLLGGIRFGIFTPTEGGAFAAVYALIVCLCWYREIGIRTVLEVSAASARTTAAVMMIVATATAIGYFITLADIPQQIISVFEPFKDSPTTLLLMINVFLFLIGMVMDLTPNVLIFAPVFYPLILDAGIDPYHFGLIFILNLGIGVITPPVGTVLYVVCGIGNIKLPALVKNLLPFIVVEFMMLILITIFPKLSLIPMNWLI